MVKLIIAYDRRDVDLGGYFQSCYNDISSYALNIGVNQIYSFDGTENHRTIITDLVQQLEAQPFIFVAFTHGREDAILFSSAPIVDMENAYFFGGALIYTCACRVANDLGPAFEHHQCKAFIGYKKDSTLASLPKYDAIFMDCENYGIKQFLKGSLTIRESFNAMYNYFSDQVFDLYGENATAAAFLLENRNALIMYPPDANVTLKDFMLQ